MTTPVDVYTETSSLAWRSRVTGRLQVWYSSTVIYEFFIDSSFRLVYSKSTDTGATWGANVVLIAQGTIIDVDIYYARWHNTSNDPVVHAVAHNDSGTRGLYYNNIDLSSDTKQTADGTKIADGAAEPNGGPTAVGMARNGNVMLTFGALSVSPFRACYLSTDGGTSFSSVDHFDQSLRDNIVIWPDGNSADTADMVAIYTDSDTNTLKAIQWDNSAAVWTGEVIIDADIGSAPHPIGAFLGSAYKRSTGTIMVALSEGNGSGLTSINTWTVLGLTATAKTDVITSTAAVYGNALVVTANGNVYCFYARDPDGLSASNMKVYYKVSTDNMATWGSETAYSTSDPHVIEQIHADPAPNVNTLLPAYLFSVDVPDGSDLIVEVPAIGGTTINLTGSLPIVFTLTGTLTGVTPASPPVVIKCQAVLVPGTIQVTAIVR